MIHVIFLCDKHSPVSDELSIAVYLQAVVIQQNCVRSLAALLHCSLLKTGLLKLSVDCWGQSLSEMLDSFLKRKWTGDGWISGCYTVAGNFPPFQSVTLILTLFFSWWRSSRSHMWIFWSCSRWSNSQWFCCGKKWIAHLLNLVVKLVFSCVAWKNLTWRVSFKFRIDLSWHEGPVLQITKKLLWKCTCS